MFQGELGVHCMLEEELSLDALVTGMGWVRIACCRREEEAECTKEAEEAFACDELPAPFMQEASNDE